MSKTDKLTTSPRRLSERVIYTQINWGLTNVAS